MAVYVDSLVEYPRGTVKGAPLVKYWCHMFADDLGDLYDMAEAIGCSLSWFQGPPEHRFPHFDLSQTYRARAIKAGAVPDDDGTVLHDLYLRTVQPDRGPIRGTHPTTAPCPP